MYFVLALFWTSERVVVSLSIVCHHMFLKSYVQRILYRCDDHTAHRHQTHDPCMCRTIVIADRTDWFWCFPQVTVPGRRVLIGWTGPADVVAWNYGGSAQSLPRDLSLAKDRSLLQRFIPELEILRVRHAFHGLASTAVISAGLQAEVIANFPPSCGAKGAQCGVSVFGEIGGGPATTITLSADRHLIVVDATPQGNSATRAGPLPPPSTDGSGWTMHAYIDHSIVEIIVNNATAFVVYAYPNATATIVSAINSPPQGIHLDVWELASANNG